MCLFIYYYYFQSVSKIPPAKKMMFTARTPRLPFLTCSSVSFSLRGSVKSGKNISASSTYDNVPKIKNGRPGRKLAKTALRNATSAIWGSIVLAPFCCCCCCC